MDATPRHRRWTPAIAVAMLAVALAIAGVHAAAVSAHRGSWEEASLEARTASARRAAALEPWSREYANRVLWLEGESALDAGDYKTAVSTLREAYRADVGNPELLALFKRAQQVEALETNKKAHLQHGHEGPGGTLAPEDIER